MEGVERLNAALSKVSSLTTLLILPNVNISSPDWKGEEVRAMAAWLSIKNGISKNDFSQHIHGYQWRSHVTITFL